jgi:ubiquinone/menaquinone biosynthesis C-methylase UbiE
MGDANAMAERVCPWWMGPLLLNPLRSWRVKPERLLSRYVRDGMTVLEPGPGMGFFTLSLARLVGTQGRVIAVDIQPKMIDALQRRAQKAALDSRIETRLVLRDSLGIGDLAGAVDFVLAFAMVHELPSAERFFRETAAVMKPGASMLLVEPKGHVKNDKFLKELAAATDAGLVEADCPHVPGNHTVLLRKSL